VATCDPPWRDPTTTLDALVPDRDGRGAVFCVTSSRSTARDCVHFDVRTRVFTDRGADALPAALPPTTTTMPPGLDVPADEIAEIEKRGLAVDVAPDGKHAVVPLPLEGVAAVFDVATKRRTGALPIVRFEANCIGPAFFLGNNAVFAGARSCDPANRLERRDMVTAVDGSHLFWVPEMVDGAHTRAKIAAHQWVVTSIESHSIMVVDDRGPAIVRVTDMPQLGSMVYGEPAIGDADFGPLQTRTPPTVALGTDGRLFSVGNRAVALVPPPSTDPFDPSRLGNGEWPVYTAYPTCPAK
jgi:hypothetical protein